MSQVFYMRLETANSCNTTYQGAFNLVGTGVLTKQCCSASTSQGSAPYSLTTPLPSEDRQLEILANDSYGVYLAEFSTAPLSALLVTEMLFNSLTVEFGISSTFTVTNTQPMISVGVIAAGSWQPTHGYVPPTIIGSNAVRGINSTCLGHVEPPIFNFSVGDVIVFQVAVWLTNNTANNDYGSLSLITSGTTPISQDNVTNANPMALILFHLMLYGVASLPGGSLLAAKGGFRWSGFAKPFGGSTLIATGGVIA